MPIKRDPWPTFPSGSTGTWPLILLAPPTTQPIKWSGWYPPLSRKYGEPRQ